jgi:hypothetical protein
MQYSRRNDRTGDEAGVVGFDISSWVRGILPDACNILLQTGTVLRNTFRRASGVKFRNVNSGQAGAECTKFHALTCKLTSTYSCHFQRSMVMVHASQSGVAPGGRAKQETTTGAARASEPLCIAQGAAVNVPKFPRPRPPPSHTPRSASPHARRLLKTSAAPIADTLACKIVPRATLELHHVFCTRFPKTTYSPGTRGRSLAHHARTQPLTRY